MYTDFFHIDSRVRFVNTSGLAPKNPSNYTFALPRLLRGVREIEVFRAEVPSSMYNITAIQPPFALTITRLVVNLPVDTFVVNWQIPPGSYTLETIVAKLNSMKDADAALQVRALASSLLFTADEASGKVTLTATNPINTLLRIAFNPYYPLGIDTEVSGAGDAAKWVVSSQHPVRLQMPTVVFLSFPNIKAIGTATDDVFSVANHFGHMAEASAGHVSRGCTIARLQLTAGTFGINYLGSENRVYLRQFPSGALNLDYLDIVFTDPLGRLIDFNGADHSLYLRIAYEAR